jgi:uncharacterized protein
MRIPILAALFIAAPANAASFDCTKASFPDERAVCTSRVLNDRDVQMALLYRLDLHLVPMGMGGILRDEQSAWLKQRRSLGADRARLLRHYDQRIARLQALIDERVVINGPF